MKPSPETNAIPAPVRYLRALAVVAAPVRNVRGDGPPGGVPLDVWGRWTKLEQAIRSASDPVTGAGAPWALVRLHPPTRERLEHLRRALGLFTRSRDLWAEIGLQKDVADEEEMIAEIRQRMGDTTAD